MSKNHGIARPRSSAAFSAASRTGRSSRRMIKGLSASTLMPASMAAEIR
jgi:hypothetical protein